MNEITTENTVEKVLSHPMNTNTAICIIVCAGITALLISKAMDKGYDADICAGEGKVTFTQHTNS